MSNKTFSISNDDELCRRIEMLLRLSLFRLALVEVQRPPNWEVDPKALRRLGGVFHRFAPQSKDRGCAYSFARALYRTAASRSTDPRLRADSMAEVGAAYFEEGRLDDAIGAFEASLSLDLSHPLARLGLLAIACTRQDLDEIRRLSKALVKQCPDWYMDRDVVAALATSPDFAFLRASRSLFLEGFGGFPEHLQALHDRHRLENLERALEMLDTDEDHAFEEDLDITKVVRKTFHSVDQILRSPQCTLHGVSMASLQARLGF